jgi:CPA2 family monovalent cation:H+ antiporter-2
MPEYAFLQTLVIIFGTSTLVVFLLSRAQVPSIVGFLLAGILIGPHGLSLVKDIHEIELLAEIGVILLLFVIGIEFSLANFMRMKRIIIGGGAAQVILTIIVTAVITHLITSDTYESIFFGFLVALSSTAIVMKLLQERGEIDTPHGKTMVGILIFQDLCVVPLMLLTPLMGGEGVALYDVGYKLLKAVLIVTIVLIAASWMVPELLHQIVRTKSRELFVSIIILLCFGTALLTSKLGLSLALGAFLAGLIISESEYASHAVAEMLPFKDSFIGLFFVSVGMLLDIGFFQDNYVQILIAVLGIFILKTITGTLSSFLTVGNLKYALMGGLGLFQIGEFSFVLAMVGKSVGLINDFFYQIFLSSSVITMIVTPLLISHSNKLSESITSLGILRKLSRLRRGAPEISTALSEHVIIVGFGINGSNLSRVLRETHIPYVIIELNADTVRKKKKKEPIFYGDATNKSVLHHAGIDMAKVLVVAISDPVAIRRIVQIARKENQHIHIIVRTRYVSEIDDLTKLGADEVIPEEFETSIEIFSRTLHHYQVPRNVISEHINSIRKNSYKAFRTTALPAKFLADRYEIMKAIETETYLINEKSKLDDYSLKELQLRTKTGATIIAVQRGQHIHYNPSPDFVFKTGDVIFLIGKAKHLSHAIEYLDSMTDAALKT